MREHDRRIFGLINAKFGVVPLDRVILKSVLCQSFVEAVNF